MVTAVAVICCVETYVFYNICIEGCQGQGYKDFVPSYLNSAGFLEWTAGMAKLSGASVGVWRMVNYEMSSNPLSGQK